MFNSEQLEDKWRAVLESPDAPKFKDSSRKSITAILLENQEKALREERAQSSYLTEDNVVGDGTGAIKTWDPVLISLVRRAMPNLISFDIAGVQPLTMPTGLIFALRSKYQNAAGVNTAEALHNEPDTSFSGPLTTAQAEALNGNGTDGAYLDPETGVTSQIGRTTAGGGFGQMGISIDRTTVTAQVRALKAEYTMEIAQDLKAVHGLDAEAELANILTTEIIGEINREMINLVNVKAIAGGVKDSTTLAPKGDFDIDIDADGRWAVEKFKSLVFQLELEANAIAKATRRGKGNFVVCSSNVASALAAAGVLDYTPALAANLQVDDTGNTFAGMINGRLKVFVDPYALTDYITVGYRGPTSYDAGLFYCPYIPLTMVRATDNNTFQPKIGFKTRYGLVANPFVTGAGTGGTGTDGANQYFRRFTVSNLGVAPGA